MFNEAAAISEGAIVQITGIVVGECLRSDGRTSYRVQFERKGELVHDWFCAEDMVDLGFDD
ncbi:hypothetical protein [Mesorhizobium sp. AA22]|uniref:hypothetical protein n=1 Tax=Mesorhizobium sp. AA22 TaxID=1854057 RepID=UPI0007FCB648|nr:hypothetical protein [Mesorhizobium sp. AA22]QIA23087.1 hypothetical protein A9K68_015890 [Mesorhizobium sp. AA22]